MFDLVKENDKINSFKSHLFGCFYFNYITETIHPEGSEPGYSIGAYPRFQLENILEEITGWFIKISIVTAPM